MTSNSLYYIWLCRAIGGSYKVYRELIESFGSVYDIYRAESEDFSRLSHRVRRRERQLSDKSLSYAIAIMDFCKNSSIALLTYEDEGYPSLLREIEDPPLLLYVRGRMPDFESRLHIAVVGTRKMTDYGKCMSYNMGYSLAKNGAIIVSGMALGCDSAAMCAALDSGGTVIGVLGCGVDIAYPPQHARFMDEIIKCGGSIISEYAPGTKPEPDFFVRRNRIISGLCRATLVIEADKVSGAIHTARDAVSQGRSLFAVPGKVGEPSSEGTLSLIGDGAKVALDPKDILREYTFLYRGTLDLMTYKAVDSHQIDLRLCARSVKSKKPKDDAETVNAIKPSREKKTETPSRIGIRDVISDLVK
ncbi:MAG: DNA-processing protein DprA, partial [Clostridia bacterium]|nr:DNA-processing protein DprA [Clostridia bacterium]